MKTEILVKKEVDIRMVRVELAVRYDDEDIPYDFPLRKGDMWVATIDIDNGRIFGWPQGESGDMFMKVCDEGSYYLLDTDGNTILSIEQDYVPNDLIPGKYGDYVDFKIDETGRITNWYQKPSISDFLNEY